MKKSIFLRVLCLILAMLVLVGCSPKKKNKGNATDSATNESQSQQDGTGASDATVPAGEAQEHTVLVTDEKETPIEGIGVYIYVDETQKELVWFDTTNEEGLMTFKEVPSETYVAVLSDVPEEYVAEEVYPLTGLETTIVLEGYKDPEYKLGDKMQDFTVTDAKGNEYSLFDLLKTKKAVVLNFWYINCNPCGLEFPYMNEAYQDYRDKLEILAMSPIDKNEDIATYKDQKSLTFPMTECEAKWEKMMQLKAYPTTVVVDREGIIAFIHEGYIDNAEDFKRIFDYFTADEYESKAIKELSEIPELEEEEKGSQDAPFEIGGVTSFEITVQPGQDFYVHLYKSPNMWMQINASDLTVTYNKQKYNSQNGSVGFLVNTPDMNSFVELIFTNNSKKEQTYKVTLSALAGSFDNPYALNEGNLTVKIAGGNEQGVYYLYRAKEDGTLTLKCTSATAGVGYDCVLNRIMANDVVVVRSLSEDGEDKTVSIPVKKGESVKANFSTLPDSTNSYPGGTFVYAVSFTAGEVEDNEDTNNLDYKVTVTDEAGKGIANVNLLVYVDEEEKPFATNAEGVATIRLPKGTYSVKVTVPEGYMTETTDYTLTEDKTSVSVVLKVKVVEMVDYLVKVLNVNAEPVSGVMVRIADQMVTTNEEGVASVNLEKGTYTATVLTVPEGFVKPAAVDLPEDGTEQVITLEYQVGSQYAPIEVAETPYTTAYIAPGTSLFYSLHNASGMVLTINNKNGAVIYNGTTYGANASGVVVVALQKTAMPNEPVVIQLHNAGTTTQTFTMNLTHPLGTLMNPQVLESLGELVTTLEENDEDGWYYTWGANESGKLRFQLSEATNGAAAEISLTNLNTSANRTLSADGAVEDGVKTVELDVNLGDVVTIQIFAKPFDDNNVYVGLPATQITTQSALIPTPVDNRITYTVTVVDEENNPWTGTVVTFKKGDVTVGEPVTVDENGVATALMEPGDYTFILTLPDTSKIYDAASCVLTEAEPSKTVTLQPKPDTTLDYTVNITKDGAAYTGEVTVQLLDAQGTVVSEGPATNGTYTVRLEGAAYTVNLVIADETLEYTETTLTKEAPTATVELTQKVVVPENITYTVKVLNSGGSPQSGVWVEIKGTDYLGQTDATGTFTQVMPAGTYNVELIFSGTTYYYNTAAAILTQVNPNLTITLAAEPNASDTTSHWFVNDAKMFNIYEGTTHLPLGTDKPYFSAENDNRCFFVFNPNRGGAYRLSLDRTDLELRDYGTTNWPFAGNSSLDSEDGALYLNVYDDSIGNYKFVFAVACPAGTTDAAITITRVGEPGLRIDQVPYDDSWKSGYVPAAFTLPSGSKLTYVDVMGSSEGVNVVYNESDGFYHWGSANGPVVYVNLGANAPYFSISKVINGDGAAGGAPIRAYFYDADGTFLKKEDYTDTFVEYINCTDKTTGVYPLTGDLAYMLQNGCKKWWTPTDPGYEMSALNGSNPEIAWLFACCYIAD